MATTLMICLTIASLVQARRPIAIFYRPKHILPDSSSRVLLESIIDKSSSTENRSILVRGGSSNYNNDYYSQDDADQYYSRNSKSNDYNDNYYNDRGYGDSNQWVDKEEVYGKRPAYQDEYQDDYYDDRGRGSRQPGGLPDIVGMVKTGNKQVGFGLLASGGAVTMLGMSLFFNKTLMRLGNLLFLAGVPMTIGPTRTIRYFAKREKARVTACLGFGIFLVFSGYPLFGIFFEIFGFLNLFGNMFPALMFVLKQIPVVGSILKLGSSTPAASKKPAAYRRDEYYGEAAPEEEREPSYY